MNFKKTAERIAEIIDEWEELKKENAVLKEKLDVFINDECKDTN